ncbi:hypothetical protein BJ170DRAFT_695812 [Xylariales sp. AK1849]|nr:hypothetical protein BJ170DRAFT_695812 [Xylariales sp. AK1849]
MSTAMPQQADSEVGRPKLETRRDESLGKPTRGQYIDFLDVAAVLLSTACLMASVMIISPSFNYAGDLGVNKQITALGVLMGIMNQCLQRILPYLFILIEARYGNSTLQNYEGLFRSSPFTSRLDMIWRILLIMLRILPIALSVCYKQFLGGVAHTSLPDTTRFYSPTAPPGLQGSIGQDDYAKLVLAKRNAVFANATIPFIFGTTDDIEFPTDLASSPKVFGFNTILLSNTSAAAIDAPVTSRVSELQQSLDAGVSILLTADVHGTVAQYNLTTGDEAYWNQTYNTSLYTQYALFNDYYILILQEGTASNDAPISFNGSWTLIGALDSSVVSNNGTGIDNTARKFLTTAMRFDVKRHQCRATWRVTRSSIELTSGTCDSGPLEPVYQYYDNCQLSFAGYLGRSLADNLGAFATVRNDSHWRVPTHATLIASGYQSIIAAAEGYVPVQQEGYIWNDTNVKDFYNETYASQEHIEMEIPTLRADGSLYFILALQPIMTGLALCATVGLFRVPISRGFGPIALLAGVDRKSLDLLSGASYSGQLKKPVGVGIEVCQSLLEHDVKAERIQYRIGVCETSGSIKRRQVYE